VQESADVLAQMGSINKSDKIGFRLTPVYTIDYIERPIGTRGETPGIDDQQLCLR